MSEAKSFADLLKDISGIGTELKGIEKSIKGISAGVRELTSSGGGLSGVGGGIGGGQKGIGGSKGVMPSSFPTGMPSSKTSTKAATGEKWGSKDAATPRKDRIGMGSFSAEGFQSVSSSGRIGMRAVDNSMRINAAVNAVNAGGGTRADKAIAGGANLIAKIGNSNFAQTGGMMGANAFAALPAQSQERISSSMYGLSDSLTLFKNLSAASGSFMPDISGTMNRATKYYNATMYGGNQMSRKAVENATYGTMQGLNGITSAGSDAAVANYLSARGMAPSTNANGVYQQTLRTVSNAARYMNISNEEAARSVEGLTSARGASDMLRNFGIYTADLSTGKEKTQTQIFEELAGRLTAGRGKATVEQTQKSIRRGSLGVTVDAFFGGDTQSAQMFKQYMIDRAAGNPMDLAANTRKSGPAGNENPLMSQMTIAGKQSGAFGAAEDEYIAGIKTATGALSALTDAAGNIAKVMGGANALIQTLMGNEQFKGAVSGLTSIVDFSSKGISGILNAARQMNPAGWAEAGVIGASMGITLGAAAGIAVGAEGVTKLAGTNPTPTGGAANFDSGGMSGMGIGTAMMSRGTGGADVANSFSMGDYSKTPGMDESATDNSGPLFSVDWLAGFQKTSEYGVSDAAHQESPHRGTDFALPVGTEVKAVGDGTVTDTRTGLGNTWGQGESASGSTGNMIRIAHTAQDGKTYYSWYLHLSEVLVSKGQTVTKGQVIGRSGNTGNSTGPHLHLEFQDENRKAIPYSTALALIGGKNAAAAQEFGMSKETLSAGMKLTKQLAQVPTQAVNAFNILKNLYSGDQAQILGAINSMAPGAGITPEQLGQYINAPDASIIQPSPSLGAPPSSGGGVNNNVQITVQVPDVTSADALKFAQMVRGYLQNDTLMSTTGSV